MSTYSPPRILLIVLGAALIVGVISATLIRMNDRAVFTVLIPGVVAGLVLIVLGAYQRTR